ncbi:MULTISPECIES: type II toxin-antitoxin system VapC family toxin [Methylomicrobium]|uniref:Putative nucleic-acid-binding protein n=1 Tax=Methylomicrobium album BG8 TaxID=686340 RepID=H8GMR6_METAL|nr:MULTISPECIES: type II toxin-antitoxin system VapC family toxin [Methylomicrobium]EIC29468.1 putative nucleic-acid-binding protein [Methylomicrobium album BG8]
MIAIDTNILARFYVEDPNDPEAVRQRPIARRILTESADLFVPLTVILELEWVLRAFYGFGSDDFARVITHLLGLSHINVENWPSIADALELHREGLDFADALHLKAGQHCEIFYSFDDRRFARRAKKLGVKPNVTVPS